MARTKDASIEAICHKLKQNHPLRIQALAVRANPTASLSNIAPALKVLTSTLPGRKHERILASWLVKHAVWDYGQRRLLAFTLREREERVRAHRNPLYILRRWIWRSFLVSILLSFLVPTEWIMRLDMGMQVLAWVIVILTMPAAARKDRRRLKQLKPAVKALGEWGIPADMVLLATLSQHDWLHHTALRALAKVVSRLRSDDYGTLPSATVLTLARMLRKSPAPLTRLLLQALTVLGDERAMRDVEWLAKAATDLDIRKAAVELLSVLHLRAEESKASAQLLRASKAPAESGQTLLRAVREPSEADPTQLLRMANAPGDDKRP